MREKRWNAAAWLAISSSISSGYYFHWSPVRRLMSVKEEIEKGVDGTVRWDNGWMDGATSGWGNERMEG